MEGSIHMYCINLKQRGDRWKRFSEQPELKELMKHHSFERFEGVSGATIDIQGDSRISLRTKRNIKEHIRRDHEELDSAGGVGCYLSHTTVWKQFLERPEPYAIIFEDDANIPVGFTESLHKAMREVTLLPQTPDVWYFSLPAAWYFGYKGKRDPSLDMKGPWIRNTCSSFTGYLISKRGAEKLLETAFPIDMHVDLYSCLAGDIGTIFTVANRNVLVKPYALKDADTDIQVASDCKICNVPTQMTKKGIVTVSIPIFTIGILVSFALFYLSVSGGRRRRV
jgi:GR25 family glycosyltransferase involved in LPS biosynthesis